MPKRQDGGGGGGGTEAPAHDDAGYEPEEHV
jgi:hypothetical protein